MKILYGIQGTGHGHISRSKALLPQFQQYGDVDVLISGYSCNPGLLENITYQMQGVSLVYDRQGKISVFDTIRHLSPLRFISDVQSLPVHDYDLIITDFEPVTAWSAWKAGKTSVALSHQAAFLSPNSPRPSSYDSIFAERLMEYFAPTDRAFGFHYRRYDHFIEPPLIRDGIQNLRPETGDHCTVYLPAFGLEKIREVLGRASSRHRWHVFTTEVEEPQWEGNILIHPVDNEGFLESIRTSEGVMTHAGFETTSEAMYLNKKLFVIPIARQYEQLCNVAALNKLGAWSVKTFDEKGIHILNDWREEGEKLSLPEIAEPAHIVQKIMDQAVMPKAQSA